MKIQIKKGFGIRSNIEFDSKDKNAIIFAPNGTGKSSIRKLFELLKDDVFDNFGIEKDGNKESLIIDSMNLEELSQNKKILVISEDDVNKINEYEDIIFGYIKEQNVLKGLNNFFNDYNSFVTKVYKKYQNDFSNNIKSKELNYFFTENLSKDNKFEFVNFAEILFNKGNPLNINESKKELQKINKDLEILEQAKQIIKLNKNINLKEICEKLKNKTKGYDFKQKEIFEIFINIKDKNLDDNFGFRKNKNEKFESIKNIYKIFEKEISDGVLKKEDIPIFLLAMSIFEKYKINPKNKTITKKQIDNVKEQVVKVEINHASNILNDKSEFQIIKKKSETNLNNFKNTYNELAKKINNKIDSLNNLTWKFKVEKINTPFHKREIKIIYENKEKMSHDIKYASSGQRKILALSLLLLNYSKYDYILLDDPISSLDSNHMYIAINMFLKIEKKCLILTHNFSLINKISFLNDIDKKFKLFIMDSIINTQSFIFENNWNDVETTYNLLQNKINEKFVLSKFSLLSSVLYEYVNQYIFPKINKKIVHNNNDYISEYLSQIKKSAHQFVRHWKEYNTTPETYYNSIFNAEFSEYNKIIFNKKSIFYYLDIENSEFKNFNKQNEEFKNYFSFKNFEEQKNAFKNLKNIDLTLYICFKYFIASVIRYETEKYILKINPKFLKNKNIFEEWNKNKFVILNKSILIEQKNDKEYTKNINILNINESVNFINHLDGLKWIPILETPIHKQIKKIEYLQKLINS